MKQVIIQTTPTVVVSLDNVKESKYYGVQPSGVKNAKGFIAKDGMQDGKYRAKCVLSLTGGNGWGLSYQDSLYNCIAKLLQCQNTKFEVFEFETATELFLWLAIE